MRRFLRAGLAVLALSLATPALADKKFENFIQSLYSPEGGEGIAAFLEKRAPNYLASSLTPPQAAQ